MDIRDFIKGMEAVAQAGAQHAAPVVLVGTRGLGNVKDIQRNLDKFANAHKVAGEMPAQHSVLASAKPGGAVSQDIRGLNWQQRWERLEKLGLLLSDEDVGGRIFSKTPTKRQRVVESEREEQRRRDVLASAMPTPTQPASATPEPQRAASEWEELLKLLSDRVMRIFGQVPDTPPSSPQPPPPKPAPVGQTVASGKVQPPPGETLGSWMRKAAERAAAPSSSPPPVPQTPPPMPGESLGAWVRREAEREAARAAASKQPAPQSPVGRQATPAPAPSPPSPGAGRAAPPPPPQAPGARMAVPPPLPPSPPPAAPAAGGAGGAGGGAAAAGSLGGRLASAAGQIAVPLLLAEAGRRALELINLARTDPAAVPGNMANYATFGMTGAIGRVHQDIGKGLGLGEVMAGAQGMQKAAGKMAIAPLKGPWAPGAMIDAGREFVGSLVATGKAVKDFAEQTLQGQEHLRRYNAVIASTFLKLEYQERVRSIQSGQATAGTTRMLGDALNRMRNEIRPIKDLARNAVNLLGVIAAKTVTAAAATVKVAASTSLTVQLLRLLYNLWPKGKQDERHPLLTNLDEIMRQGYTPRNRRVDERRRREVFENSAPRE